MDTPREYFYELRNEIQDRNGQNASFKNYFMIDTLFYLSGTFRDNISKIFSHEMKRLNGNKCELISKLRTEHIALNGYGKKDFKSFI